MSPNEKKAPAYFNCCSDGHSDYLNVPFGNFWNYLLVFLAFDNWMGVPLCYGTQNFTYMFKN